MVMFKGVSHTWSPLPLLFIQQKKKKRKKKRKKLMVVSHSIGSPDHGNFKRHIALRLSRAPLIRYESVLSLFTITLPFLFGC